MQQSAELRIVGQLIGGKLMYCGKVKAGFVPRTRALVMHAIAGKTISHCPFANLPQRGGRWGEGLDAEAMSECTWVAPTVSCSVEFTEWTEAGHLRHSSFRSLAT